jgi:hypothetical protein
MNLFTYDSTRSNLSLPQVVMLISQPEFVEYLPQADKVAYLTLTN